MRAAEPATTPERAMWVSAACALPTLLGAAIWFDWRAFWAVLLGATLAIANLFVLTRLVRALLPVPPEASEEASAAPTNEPSEAAGKTSRGALGWGLVAILKMLLLFGLLFWAMSRGKLPALGLLAGYGVMPAGLVLSQWLPQKRA